MALVRTITGIRGVTTKTWFPQPPVEWGRAGGAVATITLGSATGDNGTSGGSDGTVDNKATTTDGNGTGLKVDLTISSNVCTAIAVDADAAADGDGYRIGDKITIATSNSGTTTPVVGYVASLEYEN
tara:strand:- start:4639 stop:5019 length:381 start_codon:yes stop_codon:yes gene_type:complete